MRTSAVTQAQRIGYRYPTHTWLTTVSVGSVNDAAINWSVFRHCYPALSTIVIHADNTSAGSTGAFEETRCRGLLFSIFWGVIKNGRHPLFWAAMLVA